MLDLGRGADSVDALYNIACMALSAGTSKLLYSKSETRSRN